MNCGPICAIKVNGTPPIIDPLHNTIAIIVISRYWCVVCIHYLEITEGWIIFIIFLTKLQHHQKLWTWRSDKNSATFLWLLSIISILRGLCYIIILYSEGLQAAINYTWITFLWTRLWLSIERMVLKFFFCISKF